MLVSHMPRQIKTSDLVIWCPSVEGQTTSPNLGESPVLEMVVVIGCSVMIALGLIRPGAQQTRAENVPCSAGPSCLSQEAQL